jgi:hypothetical protein
MNYALMPRYFFNIYHERPQIEGMAKSFPDRFAAWKEATITAGRLLQDVNGSLQPGREWPREVIDEFANPLYFIHVNAERPK